MSDEIIYAVWLSEATSERPPLAEKLIRAFGGPGGVWRAKPDALGELTGPEDPALKALFDKDLRAAGNIINLCADRGIDILCRGDGAYPPLLAEISAPPAVLYVIGALPDLSAIPAVTVVGPRTATAYGLFMAEKLGYQLAAAGAAVVSGLAAGSDAAAHTGALNAGGKTVAVLGCGADVCYPPSNAALYARIAASGAIISEYSPGTPPTRRSFPQRNRIMSGISYGTAVTEAPKKSGSLITASLAADQGRTVYAVPANVGRMSEGSNGLLRAGAVAVTSGLDIIEDLYPQFPGVLDRELAAGEPERGALAPPEARASAPDQEDSGRSEAERLILSVLTSSPSEPDDIAVRTGLDARELSAALTMLELSGDIRRDGAGYAI